MGGKLHVLTDEEYAQIDARVAGVKTEWVDILNKAGYPGEAMAERVHELQAKYARPWKDSLSMKIFREGQNQ